jgi:3,4-dihydroxy 2-butanone 4-phosphate synthase / GTP cyclohydrolase II
MSNFEKAIAAYKSGQLIIVVDDESRENEGDLMMRADMATPEKVAFMVRHTTGILCVAMPASRAKALRLPLMVEQNQDARKTAFTVSVDYKKGLTTGVSATERSATIAALANSQSTPADFVRPGHIFPLIARAGGLQERQGHTEAGVALSRIVGAAPLSLLSEIVTESGEMARLPELEKFAADYGLQVISVAELAKYCEANPQAMDEKVEPYLFNWAELPIKDARWKIATYQGQASREHVVLTFGLAAKNPLVRIHSECFTGDVLHSQRCDCGEQLELSLKKIEAHGHGYVLYMRDHEGRGIGLTEKLKAYVLQDQGLDTVEANIKLGHAVDARDWSDAVAALKDLGATSLTLLTNNPQKVLALRASGFDVEQEHLDISTNEFNEKYLKTKESKLGHHRGGK